MTYSAELQAVLYASEASFCEVSSTFGTALSLISEVDLSNLARDIVDVPILKQRAFDDQHGVLMPFAGKSVTLRGRLTGLGATTAGAVPSSDLATFLGLIVGNADNALATGTTFTGGTATAPGTTAANGGVAGSLLRGGAVGDGRWGGQFHLISGHAANALALLIASAAAPSNGDLLYAGKMIYPDALTPSEFEEVTTIRLRVLTSNGQYDLRGCYPLSGLKVSGLNTGETPEWELELGVAHVDTANTTFPSATVPQRHASAPVVNGSFAIQTVGTTTRAVLGIRSIAVDLGFSGVGIMGPGGNYEGQVVQACRRIPGIPTVEVVVDKEATGTDTWWDVAEADPSTAVWRNAIYSACCADGRGLGFAWPSLRLTGKQPIQVNHEGTNRQRLVFRARTGATATTDLTASPWRMALS